jgi:hypothetical protein
VDNYKVARVLLTSSFVGDPSFNLQKGKGDEALVVNLLRLVSDTLATFFIDDRFQTSDKKPNLN